MPKQVTAMQELIDWMDKEQMNLPALSMSILTKKQIQHKATELLDKERAQIIEAYDDAQGLIVGDGDKFYQKTYVAKD